MSNPHQDLQLESVGGIFRSDEETFYNFFILPTFSNYFAIIFIASKVHDSLN